MNSNASRHSRHASTSTSTTKSGYRYDLPLHNDESTIFLITLVALMGFLATVVLGFSFSINQMMDGWSQGLENKITLELPRKAPSGVAYSESAMQELSQRVINALSDFEAVKSASLVDDETLTNLVDSWLGNSELVQNLPFPKLITVEFTSQPDAYIKALESTMRGVHVGIKINAHESWLYDLAKLTGTMQIALIGLVGIIALTTIAAIAGGMKAQIEAHQTDVELLHFIGAQDHYISSQFIRHAAILAFKGAIYGVLVGALVIEVVSSLSQGTSVNFIPEFRWSIGRIFILFMLPIFIATISALSARYTVLKVLEKMP